MYKELHRDMGRLRVDRIVSLARECFYWPLMQKDVANFICWWCQCLKQKPPSPYTSWAFTAYHHKCSFWSYLHRLPPFKRSSGGIHEYMLVVVNHFTRYAQAYVTSCKPALQRLYSTLLGFHQRSTMTRVEKFENEFFHRLKELSDVIHSRTMPYHP